MPKKICNDCLTRLEETFNFINSCHETQRRFEKLRDAIMNVNLTRYPYYPLFFVFFLTVFFFIYRHHLWKTPFVT